MMKNDTDAVSKIDYSEFIESIVADARDAAREMEIDPYEALENIVECIRDDAAYRLDMQNEEESK